MSRLGNFSDDTLAVESIFEDIGLLEKRAARGGRLGEDDLCLLIQCNSRLSRLLQDLSADTESATPCESVACTPVTSFRKASETSARVRANAA